VTSGSATGKSKARNTSTVTGSKISIPQLRNLRDLQKLVEALVPEQEEEEESAIKVDEQTIHGQVGLSVGDISENTGCSIQLKYYGENQTPNVHRSLGLSGVDSSVVLALTYRVKSGVDPFFLGELSASLKNILS